MLAAWAVLAWWTPPASDTWTLCAFRRVTGHPCPTCGMTRSLAALAKGDWRASLALHPLGLAFALQLALVWAAAGVMLARGKSIGERRLFALALADGVAFGIVWVLRLLQGA
jgi:hypothetical protein